MKTLRSVKLLSCIGISGIAGIALCAGFLNASSSRGYVAHEWGTFTSVQSGDGTLQVWNPLETSRLPNFVYNWNNPGLNRQSLNGYAFGKSSMLTLQRMETPVIYFYSDRAQTVDVSVNFPKGLITEWYPQARQIGPSIVPPPAAVAKLDAAAHKAGAKPEFTFEKLLNNSGTKESRALWSHVDILEPKKDATTSLRMDRSGSHYFAARDTDANLVRIGSLSETNPAPETEKFIFYRGVGSFATPFFVTTTHDHAVTISNTGTETLEHLYLLGVENGSGGFVHITGLNPGEHRTLALDPRKSVPLKMLSENISDDLARSLVSAGLYAREAKAMVNTWKDSWFEENGLRVLYLLPRAWTDKTLPIALNPAPRELVRVMVGRAEIIPPDQQDRLHNAITRAGEGDAAARAEVMGEFRKLGRFAPPAINLSIRNAPQRLSQEAWNLLQAANKPVLEAKAL